jgi:membrane protein YdbS with pleckstrin-like domain
LLVSRCNGHEAGAFSSTPLELAMPILLIILVAILIAQIGFWDTLGALLGAVAAIALFFIVLVAALVIAAYLAYRRFRGAR